MAKFKLNFRKVSFSQIFNYTIVILISSAIVATTFLSIPQSESLLPSQLFNGQRFDLNVKEKKYWKKEFILETNDKDPKKINETKDILFKRLQKIGVEEVQITNQESVIKVIVQTTVDETTVQNMISTRGFIRIVTRKPDVDFNSDQLAIFLKSNYDDTPWTRYDFRTIYIAKLLNSNQQKSYFALFKPWPNDAARFTEFQNQYAGQTIGVAIDDFVSPVTVSTSKTKQFAMGIGGDETQANFYSIIFNTGVIPLEYSVKDSKTLDPQVFNINYLQALFAIAIVMIVIIAYLFFTEKKENKENVWKFALTSLLSYTVLITLLKTYYIPIDLFLILITTILAIVYLKTTILRQTEAWSLRLVAITVTLVMIYLGFGYIKLLGYYLATFLVFSYVLEKLAEAYIKSIKMTVLK